MSSDPALALLQWLDVAGVAVFAASGALVASRKRMDLVGFGLVGTVTGIGGGTLRDLLLDRPVFWVQEPFYVLLCVGVASVLFVVAPFVQERYRALLWADAVGLAVFATLGARVAFHGGFGVTISVLMGVMTATFGGLIRDVLCNEIPLILRREIYATAAALGAATYVVLSLAALPPPMPSLGAVGVGFAARALGLRLGLSLPAYRARPGREFPLE